MINVLLLPEFKKASEIFFKIVTVTHFIGMLLFSHSSGNALRKSFKLATKIGYMKLSNIIEIFENKFDTTLQKYDISM